MGFGTAKTPESMAVDFVVFSSLQMNHIWGIGRAVYQATVPLLAWLVVPVFEALVIPVYEKDVKWFSGKSIHPVFISSTA